MQISISIPSQLHPAELGPTLMMNPFRQAADPFFIDPLDDAIHQASRSGCQEIIHVDHNVSTRSLQSICLLFLLRHRPHVGLGGLLQLEAPALMVPLETLQTLVSESRPVCWAGLQTIHGSLNKPTLRSRNHKHLGGPRDEDPPLLLARCQQEGALARSHRSCAVFRRTHLKAVPSMPPA